ncbi:MAG TPA: YfhO family protein [Patescibacteria group bacterium]|nr:YfhO family protein [Patescibacteria group bacterium]
MKLFKVLFPFLFLAILVIILFYKVIFLGQVYYSDDNFHLNIPEKYFLVQQITHGIFPLWNPFLFLGIPYFADFNLGTLYPLNVLYFLFPVPRALTLVSVVDIFLIGLFEYIFLRYLKITKESSLLGAIIFAFSGMPFVLISNIAMMNVIPYIPLIFYIALRFVSERKYIYLLFLICVQALQLVSGHPQVSYYTVLFLSFFLLFSNGFSWKKKISILIMYYVFSLALISAQLLPFIEYVLQANRPLANFAYATWGSMSLSYLIPFLFPTFFGTHLNGTWWGPQLTVIGYMGIPSLIFLFIGMTKGKVQKKYFFLFSLILSFLLAFGKYSPVYFLFYYLIPGIRLFRSPQGIMTFFTFFAAIFIAIGFEYVQYHPLELTHSLKKLLPLFVILFVLLGIFYTQINTMQYFWKQNIALLSHLFHPIGKLLIYDNVKLQTMFQGITANGILFLFFLIMTTYLFLLFQSRKRLLQWSFLLFIGLTLIYFDYKVLLTAPLSFYRTNIPVPRILQDAQNGAYRIVSIPVNLHQQRGHLAPADFFYQEGLANLAIYHEDNNIEQQLYQANGYTSLVPKSYAHFMNNQNEITDITGIDFAKTTTYQLGLASVKYIISHEPIAKLSSPVSFKTGKYYIYENAFARKRAYTVHEPQGNNVTFLKNSSMSIALSVSTPKRSLLVISSWYYPGWVARVNGRTVPILPYNNTFQSLFIPAGVSTVSLFYQPESLKIGVVISCLAIIVLFVMLVLARQKKIIL